MNWLERYWYRLAPLHLVLWPLSLVFSAAAALRRVLYRSGLRATKRLPVPVIVVGNISVGGTGKTPLVIWLALWLQARGYRPGIICRGYGGSAITAQAALPASDPQVVGDEAVLLARRSGCPVWRGADRVATARALLDQQPCDILISDDGLQHYALARDLELVVVDGERGFGNGMLLPAGPLREPLRRLARADAIVVNGDSLFERTTLPSEVPAFDMKLAGNTFYAVADVRLQAASEKFAQPPLHAVAAIGNPQRFFNRLHDLGLAFDAHTFPDHHAYRAEDLAFAGDDPLLMTEKDAVKCERFNAKNHWALRVDATPEPALADLIAKKLGKPAGGR